MLMPITNNQNAALLAAQPTTIQNEPGHCGEEKFERVRATKCFTSGGSTRNLKNGPMEGEQLTIAYSCIGTGA
jgi:hypothetical protein